MEVAEILFHSAEWIGTVAFAVSGAMIAIDRNLDLFGIIFLGVITALGGGTVRDVLLGSFPPRVFYNYLYVLLAVVASLVVFFAARLHRDTYAQRREKINNYINVFDAVGLGAFSVTGVEMAMVAGFGDNPFLCIFLGMTTGVGGGILRDMMSREIPFVLRKHIYALAAILGSGVYYAMDRLGAQESACILSGMCVTILIRLLAAHYRWSLPKVFPDSKSSSDHK